MSKKQLYFLLVWALIIATVWLGDRFIRNVFLTVDAPRPVAARGELAPMESQTIEIFEQTSPSVAYIFTETAGPRGADGGARQRGAGSGFIWDQAGHVVRGVGVAERVVGHVAAGGVGEQSAGELSRYQRRSNPRFERAALDAE